MDGCSWNRQLTQYLSNTCQIHFIYASHGCKCFFFLKKTYPLRNGWPQLLLRNKETLYSENKLFPASKFFRKNYFGSQSFVMSCCFSKIFVHLLVIVAVCYFVMSCYFTKIFVHLVVIVAVCYFSLHKLILWDPGNIYLFSRNTRKRYEISPKLTINTIGSHSHVLTVKCFYCWLWVGKCLSRSSFLCKYYSPKSKDEQMLYLTLFK